MVKNAILNANQIDLYIKEVSRHLPYPDSKKEEALDELRHDIQSAIEDSQDDISTVFGNPRDVARNVSQGHDWHKNRARWRTRLLAYFIDLFIEGFLILITMIIGFTFTIMTVMPFEDLMQVFTTWEKGEFVFSSQIFLLLIIITIMTIIAVIIFIGYNAVLEYYYGATIGKKLLNLGVVDQTGIKITWKQAIIRNLSKITISEEFLPIDVLLGMILHRFDPEKTTNQRGLDILAETIVIKH